MWPQHMMLAVHPEAEFERMVVETATGPSPEDLADVIDTAALCVPKPGGPEVYEAAVNALSLPAVQDAVSPQLIENIIRARI